MRIIFVSSCLEEGKDGVGDYCRRLAQQINAEGGQASLLSLNDQFLDSPDLIESAGLRSLRLPSALQWEDRLKMARSFIDDCKPDWISLQFVCYGFNAKGIVAGLGAKLAAMFAGYKVHIMFHELWIGENVGSAFRHRVVGAIQRCFITEMIRVIAPKVVHTHVPVYKALLSRGKVSASVLPLFGNVPYAPVPDRLWLEGVLRTAGVQSSRGNCETLWMGGFFGAIHPGWRPENFFSALVDLVAKDTRVQTVFVAVGRMGKGEGTWRELAARYRGIFKFIDVGEQSCRRISTVLQAMDFGVATTPLQLLPKSGTVAAMVEHGLPVFVARDDFSIPNLNSEPVRHPLFVTSFRQIPGREFRFPEKQTPQSMLPEHVSMLREALSEHDNADAI